MNITKTVLIKNLLSVLIVFSLSTIIQAQSSINASGRNTTGSSGSVSYSVGQMNFATKIGSNVFVTEGVQQPYEISIVLGLELDKFTRINLVAFPNPTTNLLTLNVAGNENLQLLFQLFDINGKLIETKDITSTYENINLGNLPSATYFLKVFAKNKIIRIFKIIKN
jgi:hypothetical protein